MKVIVEVVNDDRIISWNPVYEQHMFQPEIYDWAKENNVLLPSTKNLDWIAVGETLTSRQTRWRVPFLHEHDAALFKLRWL